MPSLRSAALLLASLAVVASAVPALADGSTVHWVDRDGRAGPSGCGGTAAASRTIGGALADAAPGDTVRVCPGTYREILSMRTGAVTLEAAQTGTVVIEPPAIAPAGKGAAAVLTIDSANGARVIGLTIRVPSAGSSAGCSHEIDGIVVFDSVGVTIRGNTVRGVAGPYSGRCGLRNGIELLGSPGALIAWNTLRDWQLMGIAVAAVTTDLSSATVRILRNSLHWTHRGPVCDGLPPCLGPDGLLDVPPSGEVFMETEGIVVDSMTAIVRGNAVIATSATATLSSGISAYTSRVKLRSNIVRGAAHGLYLAGSGGWVTGNDVADGSAMGIIVRSWGDPPCGEPGDSSAAAVCSLEGGRPSVGPSKSNCVTTLGDVAAPCPWRLLRVRGNEVHGYAGFGISTDQSGDRFTGNDLRRNPGIACADASGVPVLNEWSRNRGARSLPEGLCGRGG